MVERRKHPRIEYITKVKWHTVDNKSKGTGIIPDVSRDISAGGVSMMLNKKLETGEEIEIEFTIAAQKTFELRGEVRWVRDIELMSDIGKTITYHAGIKFLNISEEDVGFLNQFVIKLHIG